MISTIFSQQILSSRLLLVVTNRKKKKKSNFNGEFKLKLVTIYHLAFVIKIF